MLVTRVIIISRAIDEVAIFSTARTAAQISSDYNSRRFKGNETGLVALWHMDEGAFNLCSGGTNDVCDASSNTNDGAATGTTWVTDARAIMDNNSRYISLGSSTSANTDKGMEIYAISTTQFKYRWTGDQTWSSAVNFSSYAFATPTQLGTTGAYVGFDTTNGTFGDESYFLIPSWAIQQFSTTRGVRRSFPERSYLVATDRSVDIIDADDNTLWMRTSNGVTNNLLGTQTLNIPSGITMTQGQLMVGTNGTAGTGVYRLDFNRDTAYRYDVTNRTTGTNSLAKRNATDWSWGSADTGQNLIDSIVNDVSLLTSNGRLVMGTANNTGLTKIANIMSNDTSYDYSDVTSNAYNRVKLGENYLSGTGALGDMYALNSTNNALERWNNVVTDAADELAGTPDATINATSTPALFASAQTVNDLDIKTGTSLANAGNNTVFVGHNGGTTVFQENRATLASSSVKYYTKDYIGEEMIGNVAGFWPFNETSGTRSDKSLNANTLADNATVLYGSGVRGNAADFERDNLETLSISDNASISMGDIDFTFAAWVKFETASIGRTIIAKTDYGSDNDYQLQVGADNKIYLYVTITGGSWAGSVSTTNTYSDTGTWHFVVAWHDAVNNQLGIQVDNGTADTVSYSSEYAMEPGQFIIGSDRNDAGLGSHMDGLIDEVLITKTMLTSAQRTALYISGLEAKNNKYRVKLASDTLNQLAGSINVVKGVAASDQYIFAGTNTISADDGILSRVLLRGDVTDKTYDESTTDPLIVDNDINSVAVSKDGAYIIVGTDDQGITIIQNGSAANRLVRLQSPGAIQKTA